jgi:N-acetylmuramic acid 6-phosphate etherase
MIESITEQDSRYQNLEKMNISELLKNINEEDKSVPLAVEKQLPQIELLVEAVVQKLNIGGKLFYIGSGTSGRLGILDASECPPTFGVPDYLVNGIIAGGDSAIRKAQEGAEDNMEAAWLDLKKYSISENDIVIGISASGTTPYVLGGLRDCLTNHISTGAIVCNNESPIAEIADYPVEIITGPEFVTGSTRMKAGTAQKLVLNMITTAAMIRNGRVLGNKMVDMQLTNKKLVHRGTMMLMNLYKWNESKAHEMLIKFGSVRAVIQSQQSNAEY